MIYGDIKTHYCFLMCMFHNSEVFIQKSTRGERLTEYRIQYVNTATCIVSNNDSTTTVDSQR